MVETASGLTLLRLLPARTSYPSIKDPQSLSLSGVHAASWPVKYVIKTLPAAVHFFDCIERTPLEGVRRAVVVRSRVLTNTAQASFSPCHPLPWTFIPLRALSFDHASRPVVPRFVNPGHPEHPIKRNQRITVAPSLSLIHAFTLLLLAPASQLTTLHDPIKHRRLDCSFRTPFRTKPKPLAS